MPVAFRFSRRVRTAEAPAVTLAARTAAIFRQLRAITLEFAGGGDPAIPPDRVAVAEVEGQILWAPATDWKRVCYYMLSAGIDPGLSRFLRRNLLPGGDVVDLGAGLGTYTALAAAVTGDGLAHAFEPDPETYRWLVSNVAWAGGRIRTYPLALERAAAAIADIAASGRAIELVRIGGTTPLPDALGAIGPVLRVHPRSRVVVECCAALHGPNAAGRVVEEAERLGLTAMRISAKTGETEDLRREDLDTAFSIHILLEQHGEGPWSM
jgi:hypothetical protein